MPYLIDGHNLIPKIPGLQLDQLDDEQALFTILGVYFRKIRKKAVVYFDRASHSAPSIRKTAFLEARFIHKPSSADEAILLRLKELKREAHNYTIITSDHWIADVARSDGASVISSDDFACILTTHNETASNKSKNNEPNDIDYWLKEFSSRS